jgi:hypothetical protein
LIGKKSGRLDAHLIRSSRHSGERKKAVSIAHGSAKIAGSFILETDLRLRDNGAGGIRHGSGQGSGD